MKRTHALYATMFFSLTIAPVSHAQTEDEYRKSLDDARIRAELESKIMRDNAPKLEPKRDEECWEKWGQSSANQTCNGNSPITQSPKGTCNIDVTCSALGGHTANMPEGTGHGHTVAALSWQYKDRDQVVQQLSAPLEKTDTLTNCNGFLVYGKCP